VLSGEKGPRRDAVVLNAALGLVAGERAGEIKSAVAVAEESIDSGAALAKLEALVDFTRNMSPRKAAAQ